MPSNQDALTDEEKARCFYHLGYPVVSTAPSLQLGIPRTMQTQFLVAMGVNLIQPIVVDRCRALLQALDNIEARLISAQARIAAEKVGSITLRKDEADALEHEYVRWGSRLADLMGVPVYIYSQRYAELTKTDVGNIKVSR